MSEVIDPLDEEVEATEEEDELLRSIRREIERRRMGFERDCTLNSAIDENLDVGCFGSSVDDEG